MVDYEYTPLYYSGPIQVRWYDSTDQAFHGGIGYHDILITSDGRELKIDDIIQSAQDDGIFWDDAIIELEWLDLNLD